MASMIFGSLGSSLLGPLGGFLGSALGSAIDQMLFASFGPNQEGPRIENINVSRADPGTAIPLVYGADRVPGIIAASTPLIETRHKKRMGKGGGGKIITYTYHVSIDYMLCEGPILGVARIWSEGNLVRGTRYEMETSTAEYPEHIGGIPYPDYYRDHLYDPNLIPWTLDPALSPNDVNWDGKYYTTTQDRLAMYEIAQDVAEAYLAIPATPKKTISDVAPSHSFFGGLFSRSGLIDHKPIVYWRDSTTGYYIPIHEDHGFNGKSWRPKKKNPDFGSSQVIATTGSSAGNSDALPFKGIFLGLIDLTDYIDPISLKEIQITGKVHPGGSGSEWNTHSFGVDVTGHIVNFYWEFYKDGNNFEIDGREVGAANGGGYAQISGDSGGSSITVHDPDITNGTRFIRFLADVTLAFPIFAGGLDWTLNAVVEWTKIRSQIDDRVRDWPDYWNLYDAINDWSPRAVLTFDGMTDLTLYHGTMDQQYNAAMESAMQSAKPGYVTENIVYPAYIGRAHIVFDTLQLEKYGNRVPNFSFEVVQYDDVRVAMVLRDLMTRADVWEQHYDLSLLPSVGQASHVLGYSLQQKMTYRAAMETLIEAFRVDAAEIGNQIVFRQRDRAYEWEIDYQDLAAMEPGATPDELFAFTFRDRMEMPKYLNVRFKDVERFYQSNAALYARQQTPSVQDSMLDMAVVLPSAQAKAYARDKMRDLWLERVSLKIKAPHKYIYIYPSDIVRINGSQYGFKDIVFKITSVTRGANGILEIDGVLRELTMYTPLPGEVTNTDMDSSTFRPPGYTDDSDSDYTDDSTDAFLLNLPSLRPSDAVTKGFYVAFSGTNSWRGGTLYAKRSETDLIPIVSGTERSVTGRSRETILPYHMAELPDFTNSIIVDLHNDRDELESVTFEDICYGMNAFSLGKEVIQFMNAEKLPGFENRWKLSTLFRGRRGTDRPEILGGHERTELFVMLGTETTLVVDSADFTQPGSALYTAVSVGQDADEADEFSFTNNNERMIAWPVTFVNGYRDNDDNLWIRFIKQFQSIPSINDYNEWTIDLFDPEFQLLICNYTIGIYDEFDMPIRTIDAEGYRIAGFDMTNGRIFPPDYTEPVDFYKVAYTAEQQIEDGVTSATPLWVYIRQVGNAHSVKVRIQ